MGHLGLELPQLFLGGRDLVQVSLGLLDPVPGAATFGLGFLKSVRQLRVLAVGGVQSAAGLPGGLKLCLRGFVLAGDALQLLLQAFELDLKLFELLL